jgi:hypothetical protein
LLMRSLETLKLRMTAAAEGACKVAGFLNTHPKVEVTDWWAERRLNVYVRSAFEGPLSKPNALAAVRRYCSNDGFWGTERAPLDGSGELG